ncbi:MAG: hypothetical protein B7Y56_10325 [Gallionellales bacterium 35-53-114]|jgi:hypothetical protein|nr:MAG: hypothetical protein B7Y56_10325 [Gallionellales bacterium 35-53-114]OYZ62489.1 MAG: hypothetical protein B7Y04_14180 [Gallionellales bacterium 24-53-125]OZB08548.1 MAG: hypothetical protein B7X61_10390 [Gallionellales bacterium 39-52-133]HQS59519.1 hypothetical protein [Gallionellaceae bacterium]HQS76432.1 hypothetical protein [Gallionellaceae bacterium]
MNMMQQVLPVLGQVLLMSVLLAMLAGKYVQDIRKRWLMVAILLVMGFSIPLNGLSTAQWLRTLLGDLSVITLVIFANIVAQRLFGLDLLHPVARSNLLRGIVLAGVLLYPLALGLGSIDSYATGFAPLWMVLLLCATSVMVWFRGQRDLAIVLLLPVAAFNLRLLESANLWDYLLDPVLFFYALVQLVASKNFGHFKLDYSDAKVKNR